MAKIPKIPGGLPEVTEWSPEPPPQPKFTPNQPEFHGNGRYGAPANPEAPTLRPAAVEPVPKGAGSGWMRRMAPTAEGAGRMAGNAVRMAGTAARALGPAAGADVVSHFNDYKINDPSVDSSASGTFNALRQGDFSGAGRSLSKGALETLMDVGSAGANVADLFVPGKAPISTKYNNMLRQQFGDQLVDGSGAAPSASAAPMTAPTATPASAEPNVAGYSNEGRGKGPTGRPATAASLADPNGAIYRDGNSFSGKDVKFGAGVYNPDGSVRPSGGLTRNQDITNPDGSVTKSTLRGEGTVTSMDTTEGHRQNLLELQRNAAERANAPPMGGATDMGGRTTMLDDLVAKSKAGGPSLRGVPNIKRAQMEQAQSLQQEANANALRVSGVQAETARAGMANTAQIAAMHDATQRRSNDQNTATSLRGQDLSLAGHMAPLQFQQARMQLAGKYMQAAGGDPAKAQALAISDGAHDVADHFSKNVNALQGQASESQKIAKEQHDSARALFNGRGGSLIDPSLTGDAKASALKAAEDDAHNFAVQTVPGWNQLPREKRDALMPKVLGLHELHQKTKNPDHAGNLAWMRNLTSSQDNTEPATGLRERGFYKGGQIGSRYGAISGALTKDYEAGDVDFTPGGGKNSLRIAKPSAEALDALRKMTQGKDPLAD